MLSKLRSCKNIYDLSDLFQIPASALSFLIYKLPPNQRYTSFCISKKNGKTRTISAPEARLKSLQKNLANTLYECQAEIQQKRGKGASFGFCRGRSIFDNAKVHQRKSWVFNVDILDFFPSINFGRVRGYFISNKDFQLDPKAATVLAQIACWNNALPQGAPTSPIISNLICGSIDYRLSRLARRNKCSYSRYTDDLTFSTNMAEFPEEIARTFDDLQGWCAGDVLTDVIKQSGFSLNPSKSRMSFRESRQSVTGLVANAFPNTPREDRKLIRASVHRLISGQPIEIKRFCENFSQNCPEKEPRSEPSTHAIQILEGRAGHIHWIHNKSDKRDESKKFFQPTSTRKTYRDLLLYKYFVSGINPIILTEGPTDITYIKSALMSSPTPWTLLSHLLPNGEIKIDSQFYNFPKIGAEILGLSGGTGNIKNFIQFFSEFKSRLSKTVHHRPFIILLDSDKGAKPTLEAINKYFGMTISLSDDKDFYVISRGTAVVKTPLIGNPSSDIEEFLDHTFTKNPVNGRKFTREENYDPANYFGKRELAKLIYDNRSTANFTGMAALLNRISTACQSIL